MKYAHRSGENGLELSSQQLAVLSVLLRGPQTVGEIKGRTERQFEFSSETEIAKIKKDLY